MALKIVGSNPIIHPRKTGDIFGYLLFLYGFGKIMGFERRIRKHASGMFSRRGRIHGKSMASRKGVSAAFHLSVHPSAGLCILSTYDTFVRKRTDIHSDVCSFYLMMGFEELNATVRWTVAGRAGPRPLLTIPPTGRNRQ